ncbi:MAG: CARDB domain-containing protein, partial [Thermoplasmata archaeon]
MLNGGSFRGLSLPKPVSVFLAVALTFCGITVLLPEEEVLVKAPLQSAGVLNVSWANVAPDTNTFQGDVNLSMVWLAFQALGADITLESIKVDTFGLPSQAINRTFLYDDYDGDKDMSFFECIIASDDSSPYILPPSGQLLECTGMNQGQPVVIKQNQTRYFTVYLDLDFDPQQKFTDRVLRACVDKGGITSSANITAGLNDSAACSRTIDVNRRFFYDGMERGQGNWTFLGGDEAGVHPDGLWHISRGEEDCINTGGNIPFYHTGNTSWWYGHRYNISTPLFVCDYYTFEPGNPSNSTRNWGKLRTPWIDARKGTNLAMVVWHYLSREPHPGVDLAQIYVNDGAGWHYVSNEWSTNGTWRKLNFNLSAYSGKELQFEFRFDTMDELNNQFLGWFIDDLVLYGEILDHDITLTNLNIGDYVSLDPQTVTARVSNVGKFDESNIQINLTQNGTTVDQRTVPSLLSGENTTVSLNWAPPGEGIYEICVRSLPVAGEIVLWNNYQCKSVNATSANSTRVVILRSYGTQANGPRNTWDYLNNNWGNYGLNPIQIDYTSLNTYPITYEAINDTQADVLVLSGSGYYGIEPAGTELDDSETVAIERWIREGHGFVTIGTAFDQQIPNNNDLVDLVGIIDQPYTLHFADDIQVESGCINHPIFNNVPDVFQNDFGYTMSPNNDLSWDMSDLDGGQICARSPGNGSATIVIFKGAVMISFAADVTPNENERQLLYNSFVWSRFQSLDYDVKVSDLRAPRYLRPSYPANISSLVSNIGRADLPETRVDLKVDGFIVDSKNLTDLGHGNRTHANFSWTPFSVGIYQICVFAEI